MKRLILSSIVLVPILALMRCAGVMNSVGPEKTSVKSRLKLLDGKSISKAELEAFIEQTIEKAGVAGLSLSILNDAQVVYQKAFGYKNKNDGSRNDEQTIFSAASLSKAVFAYLVMLLVEDKVIDLDKPLYKYLRKPLYEYPAYADLKGDEQYKLINARMVLSHSTGLPNSRLVEPDSRLKFLFSPGERNSYSGEGIALLQMVIEEITGKDLEKLAQERIFQPLGMSRSSYIWQPEFEANSAFPHDEFGRQRGWKIQESMAGAGGSMVTTAGDYARLLACILNAEGKRKASIDEMLRPQIAIHHKRMFGPDAWNLTDEYQNIGLSWGLGWGRFDTPCGRAFFHTGHGLGCQNYTVVYVDKGIGIVLLSNSDNFETVAAEIAKKAIGDIYSPFDWLGYIPFDPARLKTTPSPDLVAIRVDPSILPAYAGTYDMQPTAMIRIKVEDDRLFSSSTDGKSWAPLSAESETRFFVQGQDDIRFTFLRDDTGTVTALQLEWHGLHYPLARKME